VNSGHTVFQGKRKLLKNPEYKSKLNVVKNFTANYFSGQGEKLQYGIFSQ